MLLNTRRTTANLLSFSSSSPSFLSFPGARPLRVATAFIEENGGKRNITAKLFATFWYLLILPDSNARLNRQFHRKRLPWYSPTRLFGIVVSAANVVSMPLSWALLLAGKRNASRIVSLGVLANPPSLTISVLLATEIASQIMKLSANFVASTGRLLSKPVFMILPSQDGGASGSESASGSGSTPANTTPTTTTTTTTQTETETATGPKKEKTTTDATSTGGSTTDAPTTKNSKDQPGEQAGAADSTKPVTKS